MKSRTERGDPVAVAAERKVTQRGQANAIFKFCPSLNIHEQYMRLFEVVVNEACVPDSISTIVIGYL